MWRQKMQHKRSHDKEAKTSRYDNLKLGDIPVNKWKYKRDVIVISKVHVLTLIELVNKHVKQNMKHYFV